MKIIAERSKWHRFALYFDYNPGIVEFMRSIRDAFGFQNFSYEADGDKKRWVFSQPRVVDTILGMYPQCQISPEVRLVLLSESAEFREREQREKAVDEIRNKDDTDFVVKGIKGEMYPFQKVTVEFLNASGGRAIVSSQPGMGKELWTKTNILTPDGWKEIGDVSVGEYVIGQNGRPTRVVGVFPQGVKPLYRVTLRDGSSVLAGLDHQWSVSKIAGETKWETMTTGDILQKGLSYRTADKTRKARKFKIPFALPVENEEACLPIKPYTLGALIGDGGLATSSIIITLSREKSHVIDKIKKENPQYSYPNREAPGCTHYTISNGKYHGEKHPMKASIASLGLNVSSSKRFIPVGYKHGSIHQRLALLRGLMDTDGRASKNKVTYSTVSEQLAIDVVEVVRSLGGEAVLLRYKNKRKILKKTYPVDYVVNVKMYAHCPFSEGTKKSLEWWPAKNRRWDGRTIDSIEYEKNAEAVCISVEAEDKLYVVQDYIVTHNTVMSLGYLTHNKIERTLVVCPASVKSAWAKEVAKWTKLSYTIIDSNTSIKDVPPDVNVWIVNYDILKKFVNEFQKTRFDCLILDECHYIKSSKSIRTKAAISISRKIPHIILLSGTPILNRPSEAFTLLHMIDPKTWNNFYQYARDYCGGHQGRWGFDVSGATNIPELHSRIQRYFIRHKKDDVLKQLPPKVRIEVPVQLPPEIQSQYDEAENNLVRYLKKYKGKQPKEIAKIVQAEKLAQLGVLRQLLSIGKVQAAEEVIESIVESGEKVLVFGSYLEPLMRLKEKFGNSSVMITGQTDVKDRGPIVDAFQNDPKVRIFIGGIKSANTGITLTAATTCIFTDYSWTPSDHEQAENRLHRPGQEASSVNIYQLHVEGTIDDKLSKILKSKQNIIDRVLDGSPDDEEEGVLKEMIDDIFTRRGK